LPAEGGELTEFYYIWLHVFIICFNLVSIPKKYKQAKIILFSLVWVRLDTGGNEKSATCMEQVALTKARASLAHS
jgi:hypothetical protein